MSEPSSRVPDPSVSSTGGVTHRAELDVSPDRVDLTAARLWAAGALGVWEQPARLVAWFPTPDPALPADLAAAIGWSLEPDRDWQAEWKATIAPVHAGRIAIVPTWLADDHEPRPDELTLVLDPGRAFGSGHHATTTMCLELLDGLALDGLEVADVGCGTGVLAIAAARRGATVWGVDIDADAVEVSRDNARRNDVELHLAVGSVAALPGPADVVVANLVTDVIVALADQLVAACRAQLVVSGIAAERADLAQHALEAAGATVIDRRERDGWVALLADVPTPPPASAA